jgi:hypothetical protein
VKNGTTTLAILAALFVSLARAEDFKTINGKEYKNATVSRVEADGIVIKTKSGISKIYFVELPKEVQQRFGYDADKLAAQQAKALDPKTPADLMRRAESALRDDQFSQGAEFLNRIVSDYPASSQANTVRQLCSFLREKQPIQDGPLTASEAQRLRAVMDALGKIKRGYRTTTPEKRRALEMIFGPETFREDDTGLGSVASSGAKLLDSRDKALQGK